MTLGEAKGIKVGTVLYYKDNGNAFKVISKEARDPKTIFFTGTWNDGGIAVLHHRTLALTYQKAVRGKVVPKEAIIL